jgi:hypothetical protein
MPAKADIQRSVAAGSNLGGQGPGCRRSDGLQSRLDEQTHFVGAPSFRGNDARPKPGVSGQPLSSTLAIFPRHSTRLASALPAAGRTFLMSPRRTDMQETPGSTESAGCENLAPIRAAGSIQHLRKMAKVELRAALASSRVHRARAARHARPGAIAGRVWRSCSVLCAAPRAVAHALPEPAEGRVLDSVTEAELRSRGFSDASYQASTSSGLDGPRTLSGRAIASRSFHAPS